METLARGAQALGLALSAHQRELFELYYRELIDWNRRVNLTTIVDYQGVQRLHFVDSLSVAPALSEGLSAMGRQVGRPSARSPIPGSDRTPSEGPGVEQMIDIGSGAGFPGLPLKILMPHLKVVLLESVAKKTAFISHLVARLGLEGVEVLTERAEEVAHRPGYREGFDAVLGRALAPLAALAELALPLARIGGRVIAHKRGDISGELARANTAIAIMGGRLLEIREAGAPGLEGHHLVVLEKVSPTPERYPRRAGIPAKRPIM